MAHGYGLGGSGSNLWTREVARALCREGHEVHLLCQESRPETLDFVAETWTYDADGRPARLLSRDVPFPGRCVVHRPELEVLPTYVRPQRKSTYVFSILDLDGERIEEYVRRNAAALETIVRDRGVPAFHVNHVLLLSEAFRRLKEATGTPYAVMPHGSAIEYVVKKDEGMRAVARRALAEADLLLVLNEDVRRRLAEVFPDMADLDARARTVRAGVDTDRFTLVARDRRGDGLPALAAALEGRQRGRDAAGTARLVADLDALDLGAPDPAGLRAAVERAADHPRGHPDADAEAGLARIGWGREPVVLHVGRFVGGKGAPSVIAAFPGVLRRHPDARLVMVGGGPLREPMEALVHALGTGRRALARLILEEGDDFDPDGYGAFEASRRHLRALEASGDADAWFEAAEGALGLDRVVFTGYLDHEALSRLYPLCDVAVFPSVVAEASPLVVAEAAAAGCLPMGTDFAGMRRTLEAIGEGLDPALRRLMKVRPEPEHVVADIEANVSVALDRLASGRVDAGGPLRKVAVAVFDWRRIGEALVGAVEEMRAA